jgi:hypothetical protein
MDRQSFINQNYLNTTADNFCGEKDCICEGSFNKIKSSHLIVITITAFFCSVVFVQWKVKASSAETLTGKRSNTIACGYDNSINRKNIKDIYNDHSPFDKNNGNNCPHQFNGSGSLCCTDHKRKRNNMT